MAIDIEALKRKVAQLKGEDKKGNKFKPTLNDNENSKVFEVRVLPLTKGDTSTPCREVWHYPYDVVGGNIVTLKSQGKPDPIEQLLQELRKDYDKNKDFMKKLYPKMSAFANVIVRGQEDKGVQEWKLTKIQYERILSLMLDDDYGDVTDPVEGRDLKVTIDVEPGKFFKGKRSTKLTIDARGKSSALSADAALAKKWLDSCPDPMDSQEVKTFEEVTALLEKWLAAPPEGGEQGDGEQRGGNAQNTETPADSGKEKAKEEKATKPKKSAPASSSKELDDAFAELENDIN